jgi:hypothetical protein
VNEAPKHLFRRPLARRKRRAYELKRQHRLI